MKPLLCPAVTSALAFIPTKEISYVLPGGILTICSLISSTVLGSAASLFTIDPSKDMEPSGQACVP